MTINERFRKIINELYSGNQRSFSIAAGVNPTVTGNVVGARAGNPSFEFVQKVLSANANIRAEWLILERGEMLRDENDTDIVEIAPKPQEKKDNPIIEASSMGFFLDRYEAMAIENAQLKKEIQDLRNSVSEPHQVPEYPIMPANPGTHIAAEPE